MYARPDLCRGHDSVLPAVAWLCAILRPNPLRTNRLRQINMNAESIIMLIVSAGLMVYLLYALLRPEKF
jgi:K+-transporting ATPase KdpF subunit